MSSNCSNCYNNCVEIVSDKCVKYTGVDVPVLGISKGDSLSFVEQALITFLTSTINGSGIKIELEESDYCEVVSQYLQECETVTALDLFKALVKASCNIQEQISTINGHIAALNPAYAVGCLDDVNTESTTPEVLQAVIVKLCSLDSTFTALVNELETNYIKVEDIDAIIEAWVNTNISGNKFYTKMVPYTILPYYGELDNFGVTGIGLGDWEKIYLCNGLNGTPDLRGRTLVGAISGVPGPALPAETNPSNPFNPNYAKGSVAGANSVILSTAQLPAHSHDITDPGHTHTINTYTTAMGDTGSVCYTPTVVSAASLVSESSTTGITINDTGEGAAHNNIQPVRAVYFIMYIP